MDIPWLALSAVLKALLALGPITARSHEFNLGADDTWQEARAVASVSALRGVMASLPVMLALQTYAQTEKVCANPGSVYAVHAWAIGFIVAMAGLLLLRTPAPLLRGPVLATFWIVLLIGAEYGYTYWSEAAAKRLCSGPVATAQASGTPASGPASAAASQSTSK